MRFIHTADWQIGMRAKHAGARAADIREQRLRTVERIVEVANEERVDFVVVAGDQFEDSAPHIGEIASVVAALRKATMPVFVLPGNHDPARIDSPYSAAAWRILDGTNVNTVREPASYEVPGGVLLAAPCITRFSVQDPTLAFKDMVSPDGATRIGCAHGTLQIGSIPSTDEGHQRGGHPIALDAASRSGISYLALGHFHSRFERSADGATIAYSGTPEPTSYADRDCGTVSLVTIEGPRAQPSVLPLEVAGLAWHEKTFEVSDLDSFNAAIATISGILAPERAVVRARFRGILSPDAFAQAAVERAAFASRFFSYEEIDEIEASPESSEAWLRAFPTGLALEVAERLVENLTGENASVALRALARLREVSR